MAGRQRRFTVNLEASPHLPAGLLLPPELTASHMQIVLGSRSPRRRDLLSAAVGADRLICLPPASSDEAGFDGLRHDSDILDRLQQILETKHRDVLAQLPSQPWFDPHCPPVVVVADTTVVAGTQDGFREVCGQPDPSQHGADVRDWLTRLLAGKTHKVHTAVMASCGQQRTSQIVTTEVEFVPLNETQIDWYVKSGEPQGKAGGYAIQGLAAAFVHRVSGSLTTVIGLPLLETLQLIRIISQSR
jgi:septum formation protein